MESESDPPSTGISFSFRDRIRTNEALLVRALAAWMCETGTWSGCGTVLSSWGCCEQRAKALSGGR